MYDYTGRRDLKARNSAGHYLRLINIETPAKTPPPFGHTMFPTWLTKHCAYCAKLER
jgi:hypothetical protein